MTTAQYLAALKILRGALMPRPTIDYLNARRAILPASGGKTYNRSAEYAPDYEPDTFELALSQINSFALWAETNRARYLAANGLTYTDLDATEIPF